MSFNISTNPPTNQIIVSAHIYNRKSHKNRRTSYSNFILRTFGIIIMKLSAIYCITKSDELGLFEKVEFLLKSGIDIIQLRDKSLSIEIYQEKIQKYKPLFLKHKAQLIVNDHISVAIEEGVGLHIGWEDLQKYAEEEGIFYTEALVLIRSQIIHNTL